MLSLPYLYRKLIKLQNILTLKEQKKYAQYLTEHINLLRWA